MSVQGLSGIIMDTRCFDWLERRYPLSTGIAALLVLAVFFAECSSSGQQGPSDAADQVNITAIKTPMTLPTFSARPPAPIVYIASVNDRTGIFGTYHFGGYNRVEYRNTVTQNLTYNSHYQEEMHEVVECSWKVYNAIHAICYTVTQTTDYPGQGIDILMDTTDDSMSVTERCYSYASPDIFIGGTRTEIINGVVQSVTDLPADAQFRQEDRPQYEMGLTPFGAWNFTLTAEGTEPITVPAGTFSDARKYTGSFRDRTPITFWAMPGVPVPVRYQFPNKYLNGTDPFQSYELIGWR
jgi:hypothetical protein